MRQNVGLVNLFEKTFESFTLFQFSTNNKRKKKETKKLTFFAFKEKKNAKWCHVKNKKNKHEKIFQKYKEKTESMKSRNKSISFEKK